MEPAHTIRKDRLPVEIARLQLRRGLVRAVIEHNRRANSKALIAIHRRHIRPAYAVMLELLVERLHAHRQNPLRDQIANRILHHRARDSGAQLKAVRQVRRNVELAAAYMHRKIRSLAERYNARIEPVYQRTQRKQIQRLLLRNFKTKTHNFLLKITHSLLVILTHYQGSSF